MKDFENIKIIKDYDALNICLKVIHESYKKRDKDLELDNYDNFRHSYITYEKLKDLFDSGIKMYGHYLNEKLVAFLALDIRKDEIKIKDIVVLPEYQNKGIGTILLDFVKNTAIEYNKKKIILGMIYDNEKLKQWYEKYGFTTTEIVKYPNSTYEVGYMEYIVK